MAQEKIKKVRFKQATLPPLIAGEEGYVLRYRIVSEDKNRSSHWSPIQTIKPNYQYTLGTISNDKQGSIVSVVWDAVVINKDNNIIANEQEYDVWVRWDRNDGGDWISKQRINGTNISLLIPETYTKANIVQGSAPNKFSIEVYMKGSPITRADGIPGDAGVPILKAYQILGVTV